MTPRLALAYDKKTQSGTVRRPGGDVDKDPQLLIIDVMRIAVGEMRAMLPGDGMDDARDALDNVWEMSRSPDRFPPLLLHAGSIVERSVAHVLDVTYSEIVYWARPGYPERHILKHARAQLEQGLATHNLLGYPHPKPCRPCLRPENGGFDSRPDSRVEPVNDWEKSCDHEYLAAGKAGRLPPGQQVYFDWKQKMQAEHAEYERQLAIDRANGYMTIDEMVEAFDKDQCCHCEKREFLEDLNECARCKRRSCLRSCGEWTTEIDWRWLCNECIPAAIIESAHRFG
jgi:hypothetical protein